MWMPITYQGFRATDIFPVAVGDVSHGATVGLFLKEIGTILPIIVVARQVAAEHLLFAIPESVTNIDLRAASTVSRAIIHMTLRTSTLFCFIRRLSLAPTAAVQASV
jgi:hypothetical protein